MEELDVLKDYPLDMDNILSATNNKSPVQQLVSAVILPANPAVSFDSISNTKALSNEEDEQKPDAMDNGLNATNNKPPVQRLVSSVIWPANLAVSLDQAQTAKHCPTKRMIKNQVLWTIDRMSQITNPQFNNWLAR